MKAKDIILNDTEYVLKTNTMKTNNTDYNYPKEIVKAFVCFLGVNGLEKEIDKIEKLSQDHEVLFYEQN